MVLFGNLIHLKTPNRLIKISNKYSISLFLGEIDFTSQYQLLDKIVLYFQKHDSLLFSLQPPINNRADWAL